MADEQTTWGRRRRRKRVVGADIYGISVCAHSRTAHSACPHTLGHLFGSHHSPAFNTVRHAVGVVETAAGAGAQALRSVSDAPDPPRLPLLRRTTFTLQFEPLHTSIRTPSRCLPTVGAIFYPAATRPKQILNPTQTFIAKRHPLPPDADAPRWTTAASSLSNRRSHPNTPKLVPFPLASRQPLLPSPLLSAETSAKPTAGLLTPPIGTTKAPVRDPRPVTAPRQY